MDHMGLDPASDEPARQPEAVAASLIGQHDPADRPASTHRLVPPPLDQSQQYRRIRLQFFNGWRSTPGTAPLTSQLALLISTTTTKVEIGSNTVRLRLRSLTWAMGQLHQFVWTMKVPRPPLARPVASLLQYLFDLGRRTADEWLARHEAAMGHRSASTCNSYCR
jgi:hypothetical protein